MNNEKGQQDSTPPMLTMEQQFQIQKLRMAVKEWDNKKLQELLIDITIQLYIKDNLYKELIKKKWGL